MTRGWGKAPEYGASGGKPREVIAGLTAIAVSVVLALSYFHRSDASAQTTDLTGVASVIDGDTIEIHGQSVRLSGFDSPERGAACGQVNVYQRAAMVLSDYVGARTVHCRVSERDRYNRAVATCSVAGVDLGEYMVAAGWARDWPRYSAGRYADEEARARRNRAGIWGMVCPADLWGEREYSSTSAPAPASQAAREAANVTASSLNVRAGPGADHPVVGRLAHRSRIEVLDRSGEWVRTEAGWVSSTHLSATQPAADAASVLSDARIRTMMIERSLAGYSGSCPCPYNVDRAGRRCGGRSAYSRPGGASPTCYASDISDAQVRAFRSGQW